MAKRITNTHFEIECGWPISDEEHAALPANIAEKGFRFRRRLLITDFILPTLTTNRLRIMRIWEEGQKERVMFIRCVKNHPLKGETLEDIRKEREFTRSYLGFDTGAINWVFIRTVLASVAATAIIPLQDVLGLGSEARLNLPGTVSGNWKWRYRRDVLTPEIKAKLKDLTLRYDRHRF